MDTAEFGIPFEQGFKEFANSLKEDSYKSYLTYLKAAYEHLCPQITVEFDENTLNGQYFFDNIEHLFKNQQGRELTFLLLNILIQLPAPENSISSKYLGNIRTALRWYLAYLSTDENIKGVNSNNCIIRNGEDCKRVIDGLESNYKIDRSFFSKAALEKIFIARLLTQDRTKGNYAVDLPIRKISKEISHHKLMDNGKKVSIGKWFGQFIKEHLFFIIGDARKIPFKEVKSLTISDDGGVRIKVGKKSETVYFETNDAAVLTSFKDYCKKSGNKTEIRDLALDHDTPIFHILHESQDKLDTLKEFNKLTKGEHLSREQAEKLYKEFTDMHNEKVNFTIMHQIENVKKGKK